MTDTTEVIAVSFGEQEDESMMQPNSLVAWFKARGWTLDLDSDRLTNGTEATNCCVMGPYILFKEADQPFPPIVFEYISSLQDKQGVISMMQEDSNDFPIHDTQADLYVKDFIAFMAENAQS